MAISRTDLASVLEKTALLSGLSQPELQMLSSRIKHNAIGDQNIREAILRDQQKKSNGGAYDCIGAKSRALVADLALQPDYCREQECNAEFGKLAETLPGRL